MQVPKRTTRFKIQMKRDMVRFNSSIISDDQQTESVVTNILLKLADIVFLEVVRDIHLLQPPGCGLAWPTRAISRVHYRKYSLQA